MKKLAAILFLAILLPSCSSIDQYEVDMKGATASPFVGQRSGAGFDFNLGRLSVYLLAGVKLNPAPDAEEGDPPFQYPAAPHQLPLSDK